MLTEAEERECKEAREAWLRIMEEGASEEIEFKAWKRWQKAEEKLKTRGAEPAPDALYSVYYAIYKNLKTTEGMPRIIALYFMSDWHEQNCPDTAGVYGYGCIMIRKDYYEQHGIDEDVINTIFHEMIHAACDMKIPEKKIKDTEGEFHLPAFKEACERYGGICSYVNEKDGYSNARLTDERMEKVKARLRKRGII